MKAQYISTPGRARKIIAVVWMAAIGLSALPAYFVTGVSNTFFTTVLLSIHIYYPFTPVIY